jgi:hypothetical protein
MTTAAFRATTWVPVIGFAGALAALLLAPGLVVADGAARTGVAVLGDAANGVRPWSAPPVLALLAASGAALTGLLARRAPAVARLMALGGLLATAAFSVKSGSGPTFPYYAALGGFALAFLGSRTPGCGPVG